MLAFVPPEAMALLLRIADGIDDLRSQLKVNNAATKTAATVEEAAQLLACSRTVVFGLLKAGILKRAGRHGRSRLVTAESIRAALATSERSKPLRQKRSQVANWKPLELSDFD